jgi:hypothetical protein
MMSNAVLTSKENPLVRAIRLAATQARRSSPELVVAEGLRVLEEATSAGCVLEAALIAEGFGKDPRERALLDAWSGRGFPIRRAAASVLKGLSDVVSHPGALALVRIPTSPDCPSMNLGQAVAVCCYELARAGVVSTRPPRARVFLSEPANLHSLEHLFERIVGVLDRTGYTQPKTRQATLIKLRRVLLDLGLTNNDVRILGGILAQIEWKLEMQKTEVRSQKAEGRMPNDEL